MSFAQRSIVPVKRTGREPVVPARYLERAEFEALLLSRRFLDRVEDRRMGTVALTDRRSGERFILRAISVGAGPGLRQAR